ncbi:MAG: hypothetical protein AAF685_18270 [Cyanobacteria bacterium P01_C01_bin.89]
MNAVKKATSITITSKIAAIASLLRSQMPYAQIGFSPWVENDLTLRFEDRHSIDLSVNFPQSCEKLRCRCMLVQVTISSAGALGSGVPNSKNAVGASANHPQAELVNTGGTVEAEFSGYGFDGTQQWKFATADGGKFLGKALPSADGQQLIRSIGQSITELSPSFAMVESRKAS